MSRSVSTAALIYVLTFALLWIAVRYSAHLGQITLPVVGRL